MYYSRAMRYGDDNYRPSAPRSPGLQQPASPMSPRSARQTLLKQAAVIGSIETDSSLDQLEDNLSVEELAERLRCEKLKATSLANLFQAYEAECDTEIKRIRRLSERTIQNERRVSGLEPGNVVRATATFALEPELERIRAIVSAAAESALAAQAEAHEEAQRRMVETLTRLEACARSLGALRAAGARAGADAAGEGAESAAAEGAAPADAAAAELEALRAELAAERERSAALELTCAQLIKGATSSYHAPKGGAKRIDQRLEAQPAVHGARLSKAFAGHPYSTEDTTLYTPAHTAGAAQPAQPQRTGSEDGAPAGGAREGADATPADSVDLAGGDEAAPRLAQEDSGGEERAAEAGGEGGAQPADAEAEREQQQDGYEGGRAAQHESEGESDDGALM